MKSFIMGSHCTAATLSCVGPQNGKKHRLKHRSNQQIEGGNKFKNHLMQQITGGGPVKGEYWLQLFRKLAKRTRARIARINETGKFKAVRSEKTRCDNQYMHI